MLIAVLLALRRDLAKFLLKFLCICHDDSEFGVAMSRAAKVQVAAE